MFIVRFTTKIIELDTHDVMAMTVQHFGPFESADEAEDWAAIYYGMTDPLGTHNVGNGVFEEYDYEAIELLDTEL